jgi:hypothetical protein
MWLMTVATLGNPDCRFRVVWDVAVRAALFLAGRNIVCRRRQQFVEGAMTG